MGLIHIMERGGDDVRRFEESLRMAKKGIKEACEIFEDMKAQFSERGGSASMRGYSSRDEWEDYEPKSHYRGGYR